MATNIKKIKKIVSFSPSSAVDVAMKFFFFFFLRLQNLSLFFSSFSRLTHLSLLWMRREKRKVLKYLEENENFKHIDFDLKTS
jgi:hypothetical protein